ncbi:hypothetical protein PORCRE_1407 [Porphyromonas crevioricanis JCM 15906]|uniref:Uncharacterized protein n=1 Tax=Porphyromonas crevioricanis JCM 15906 TaxID=1305617 RepID=T1CI21_9PORP|nr:hypothetical protein PORCRE_1407 [Porphyromonas crevioricanis JCM 15906]GAD06588.1 hypothetical protein PORCAN_185 [Porphyromonas crevioricanis JCM 13913]
MIFGTPFFFERALKRLLKSLLHNVRYLLRYFRHSSLIIYGKLLLSDKTFGFTRSPIQAQVIYGCKLSSSQINS